MRLPRLFRRKSSREVAMDRLKILLISDRVNCSPEVLDMIKRDIAQVISRYMKIDTQNMEIQISKASQRGREKTPSLHANIPILDLHKIS
ncbi:MAG: cell division topological specificity factor MinE [Eubacteriales bacterium]|nr:cell division topological specificity factor MinE [Eubacteriales bacterium]